MGIFDKQKSLWGLKAYISPDNLLVSRGAIGTGGEGKPRIVLPGASDTVAEFDDFLGDALATRWIEGSSDTGQANSTGILATSAVGATNGLYRMSSSVTSTQTPAGGAQSLNGPPNWKANQGRLRFAARVKIADLAKNNVYVGLTDTGGTELAVYDTGGGIITPAGDYVGFLKGGGAAAAGASLTWRAVAGKAGTDQVATTGITPVANVYDELEVELPGNDGNVANFYINGKHVAAISSAAVTPTVALAGGVWRANTEAAQDAVDVDYINISAGRDTGV
jgi:hypothetical protein